MIIDSGKKISFEDLIQSDFACGLWPKALVYFSRNVSIAYVTDNTCP